MKEWIPTAVTVISRIMDQDETLLLELKVGRRNQQYLLNVASEAYIMRLREANQALDPSLRGSENIFPLKKLEPIETVAEELSQIPDEELNPYLEPIRDPE